MAEDKINMNWPEGLKKEIRDLVGPRGVTAFVITAVRKELDLRTEHNRARQSAPVAPAPVEPEVIEAGPARVAVTDPPVPTSAPAPRQEHQGEAGPDYKGAKVEVDAPTLGVAAKFSSSSSALAELQAKAAHLGLKRASDLPPVTIPREPEPPRPAYVAPEPAPVVAVERVDPAVPVPAYAARNLDDIEIDF